MSNWRIWAFPLFVLLVVLFSAWLVLVPSLRNTIDSRDDIQQKSKELDKLISRRLFLETLSEQQLRHDLDIVESVLYSRKPVMEFMAALDQLAGKYDISVGSYELNPGLVSTDSADEKKDGQRGELETIDIEVKLEGDKEQMFNFLEQINYVSPVMTLSSFSVLDRSNRPALSDEGNVEEPLGRQADLSVMAKLNINYSLRPKEISERDRSKLSDLTDEERQFISKLASFQRMKVESMSESLNRNRTDLFDY